MHVVVSGVVQCHSMKVLRCKCDICTAQQEMCDDIFLLILGAHRRFIFQLCTVVALV